MGVCVRHKAITPQRKSTIKPTHCHFGSHPILPCQSTTEPQATPPKRLETRDHSTKDKKWNIEKCGPLIPKLPPFLAINLWNSVLAKECSWGLGPCTGKNGGLQGTDHQAPKGCPLGVGLLQRGKWGFGKAIPQACPWSLSKPNARNWPPSLLITAFVFLQNGALGG